ncbi:MAG: PhzF family phenazine biosynthesis protein [Austwickia sp.]|jgi:trans-2,3-dihydro-3-hydroxyanthranilate isomerase|nr:MAG: PhzF family phenazine biosynthesis protein [Austwickia sp.]
MDLSFRLINVFAESNDPFSGNAVAIFDNAPDVSDEDMASIAQQLTMETVFVRSIDGQSADIRHVGSHPQARLAGSPALGAAHVIDEILGHPRQELRLSGGPDAGTLTILPYGKDNWRIQARAGEARKLKSSPQILASLVGLQMNAISDEVMVIDSGRSGVVLPVNSVADVDKTHLDARMLHSYAMLLNCEPQVYVWARKDDDTIVSRMFFGPGGGVLEVAATGSGAANLGHWLSSHGETGKWRIYQGAAVGRPSVLDLEVQDGDVVFVGGHVNQIATGTMTI